MATNITFRTQLLGGVSEFCDACRIPLLATTIHLVELIVLLARYKEEGSPLYPEVYITNDITKLKAMLPESEVLSLGQVEKNISGIKFAIKKSAPLATQGWLIYIEDRERYIAFGVFHGGNNPVSVLVDTVLLDPTNPTPVTKIFQVAEDCVEIVNCTGERHFIFLNHRKDDSPPPLDALHKLVGAITKNVPGDISDQTSSYLTRVMYDSLRVSHGTLIAVTNSKRPSRKLFRDGMSLATPIDIPQIIRDAKKGAIPPQNLISTASIVRGMLSSDGIVLFNSQANLLGFNYFVNAAAANTIPGGARQRAFSTLTKHVGKGLLGAFIQSQDGWSEFRGTEK